MLSHSPLSTFLNIYTHLQHLIRDTTLIVADTNLRLFIKVSLTVLTLLILAFLIFCWILFSCLPNKYINFLSKIYIFMFFFLFRIFFEAKLKGPRNAKNAVINSSEPGKRSNYFLDSRTNLIFGKFGWKIRFCWRKTRFKNEFWERFVCPHF